MRKMLCYAIAFLTLVAGAGPTFAARKHADSNCWKERIVRAPEVKATSGWSESARRNCGWVGPGGRATYICR
jgi:hypothetical protein